MQMQLGQPGRQQPTFGSGQFNCQQQNLTASSIASSCAISSSSPSSTLPSPSSFSSPITSVPMPLPTSPQMLPSPSLTAAALFLAQQQQAQAVQAQQAQQAAAKLLASNPSLSHQLAGWQQALLLSPAYGGGTNSAMELLMAKARQNQQQQQAMDASSPCPTPAYHYQLAAPKPIQPAMAAQYQLGLFGMGLGVDLRPADSTTTPSKEGGGQQQMDVGIGLGGGGRNGCQQQQSQNGAAGAGKEAQPMLPPHQHQQQLGSPPSSTSSSSACKPTTTGPGSGAGSPRRFAVPCFQISPAQLHLAMQQFFRSQQSKESSFDSGYSTTTGGTQPQSPALTENGGPSSPKRSKSTGESSAGNKSRTVSLEEIEEEAGGRGAEEYVDVVGDGEARSSFLKLQRKAHIEFYRKLKSFRNRGDQLDCQLCSSPVPNSDASIRSHVHSHCKTALFVCKLCQRGFQDQHLVFEHICREHPTHQGSQFIEDRRDMGVLMELLAECFPRVLCRARDCLFEAIGRLTAWAECQGQPQMECRLCSVQVLAQKNALYGHLNQHPSYKCKKCKFSCTEEGVQLEHQRREHPGLDLSTAPKERVYCVSLAFDVLLDTLKSCFPLEKIGGLAANGTQTLLTAGAEKKPKEKKPKVKKLDKEEGKSSRRSRKRKHKDSTTSEEGGAGEEECSWTEED